VATVAVAADSTVAAGVVDSTAVVVGSTVVEAVAFTVEEVSRAAAAWVLVGLLAVGELSAGELLVADPLRGLAISRIAESEAVLVLDLAVLDLVDRDSVSQDSADPVGVGAVVGAGVADGAGVGAGRGGAGVIPATMRAIPGTTVMDITVTGTTIPVTLAALIPTTITLP
jgi:hypothetical protein